MKLLYLIPATYRPAGMERVLANKTKWLVSHGYEIIIATTDQMNRHNAFSFDEKIRFVDLGINYEENNGQSFFRKVISYPGKQIRHKSRLKALVMKESPDVIVSMFGNEAGFIPSIANGAKTVLEIHFSRYKRIQYGRTGLWAIADTLRSRNDVSVVKRFDRFIVLTEEDKQYWGGCQNIRVIPNARTFTTDIPALLDKKVVLAAGRYNFQKQFDVLIDVWSIVVKDFPDWSLRLVGDGEDRQMLEKKIRDNNLQDSVMLGSEKNMKKVYESSSVFALSSRFEGLPMVLLEAQAFGLPIVSFECKCGPKDVVTDGVDGFLVKEGDVTTFADRLSKVMRDSDLRHAMGRAAYVASNRFDEDIIMNRWERLFQEL